MSTTVATIRPVPESGGDAAETLPQALGRLRVALNDAFEACSQELGLTAQQCELLCAVQQPSTVGGLAQALHCDRSNVSRLVDRVSSRGLVRRRRGEDDGRVTVVELTAGENAWRCVSWPRSKSGRWRREHAGRADARWSRCRP